MNEPSPQKQQQQRAPLNFSLITSGLFVVIIALLAILWTRERTAGSKAHKDLAGMTQQCARMGKQLAIQEGINSMLRAQSAGRVRPFVRADLVATREVRLDGGSRQALEITAAAGSRLGFDAGDLIIVSKAPPPATEPASKPSTTSQP